MPERDIRVVIRVHAGRNLLLYHLVREQQHPRCPTKAVEAVRASLPDWLSVSGQLMLYLCSSDTVDVALDM